MPEDLASLHARGFGGQLGFGRRCALLVVDFTRNFTSPSGDLGAEMGAAIAEANRLIAAARRAGAPVYFSTIAYADPATEAGIWAEKIRGLGDLVLGTPEVEQDPRLDVAPNDTIIVKKFASCFFDTTLGADLRRREIDTLIIAGCSTSGCVRASAVDACQHGLRTIVAREAVADRLDSAHAQSLVDIALKYGDVLSVDEIITHLHRAPRAARLMA